LGAGALANAIAPISQSGTGVDPNIVIQHERIQHTVSLFSPVTLYSDATSLVLNPMSQTTRPIAYALMGPLERLSLSRFQNPLPLLQSLIIVWPYLVSIVAITFVCFGLCYFIFMRQEIRTV
jgi:ABC-2 type transport system permease protein